MIDVSMFEVSVDLCRLRLAL